MRQDMSRFCQAPFVLTVLQQDIPLIHTEAAIIPQKKFASPFVI
jgi:hypothetical protein